MKEFVHTLAKPNLRDPYQQYLNVGRLHNMVFFKKKKQICAIILQHNLLILEIHISAEQQDL